MCTRSTLHSGKLFIQNFTTALTEEDKAAAAERLSRFFEEEVKGGYLKLSYFAENLDLFLDNNYSVVIMVKGFSSPLASQEYNLALSNRRIASVLSYFRKYQNGIYSPYIQNGQLQVMTAPLGEREVRTGVSDSRYDKRSSVYSVEASMERRTDIIEVKLTKN
ncbi:MAG: hypothetical protein IPL65_13030 [Lewinellaceae bacterium]|nr:hypothetical protein [Lewinellaceae bacterium]